LTPALELAVALNARHLNIIGAAYPFSVAEGADDPYWSAEIQGQHYRSHRFERGRIYSKSNEKAGPCDDPAFVAN
jgi:hypothetical protein